MVSERYFLGGAIIISILLHIAAVPLYDKFLKKPIQKKKEPIEVSYLPQKKEPIKPIKANKPISLPQNIKSQPKPPMPDYTDDTNRKTSFDDKLIGGNKVNNKTKTVETKKSQNTKSLPKPNKSPQPKPVSKPIESRNIAKTEPNGNLALKETENNKSMEKNSEDIPEPNIAGLLNTKDIVDKIANAKEPLPKGQDSASYNKFEGKYASYFAKFKNSVYQIWDYPQEAIAKGETGTVRVSFAILKDGSVVNIKLMGTSGYPELDKEVMRVLKNIRKTPLPDSYELNQLNIDNANFVYTIGRGWSIF